MMMPDWSNSARNLCVICGTFMQDSNYCKCLKCNQICDYRIASDILESDGKYGTLDIKSICCNADVYINVKTTCSDKCHQILVKKIEGDYGSFKKVIDAETNIAYRIPTKDIIEKGLTQEQLKKYPEWKES